MNELDKVKEILLTGGYTCVLCKEGLEYSSTQRGVKPLLDLLDSKKDLRHAYAADKTVGAGAAHLYALLGVSAVWARVMSERGRQILLQNGIEAICDDIVPFIINRAGDGMCPIESAVGNIDSPTEALAQIRLTLSNLANKS